MIELTKMFALPKFESLRGSISASLNIGEILAILKPLASSVLKLRVALILRHLLTHLLLMQTKLALANSVGNHTSVNDKQYRKTAYWESNLFN